jgi:hypothetical protein
MEEIFQKISKDNTEAYNFCKGWHIFAHRIDDHVDEKTVENLQDTINLLMDLLNSNYYRKHYLSLQPLIEVTEIQWTLANLWENSEKKVEKFTSEFLRSASNNILLQVAWLEGGRSRVREVIEDIYKISNRDQRKELDYALETR